ncbi:hypothetical protein AUR64_09530 [Haloprofundus marisrubri]|uniref:Small CPxCG-related zinc finger protein n=1 Tax=Haloprofundus marisrubri TaxID=1514971 RepID=A0A0W1R868_9EURY|nr:hypothetical protein [Haloprofundus marisrubri]KTG09860.1 hypothetical protein AUR64_09530 [Haloprofundus marisrubri]
MPLSEYTGRRPRGASGGATISRAVRHHHWQPNGEPTEPCANCGHDLSLRERHVLVTLVEDDVGDAARRYLCNETCLREWVDDA